MIEKYSLYHHPTQRTFEVKAESAHNAVLKHLGDTMEKLSAPLTEEMREIYLKHLAVTKEGSAWTRNALDVFDSGLDEPGRAAIKQLDATIKHVLSFGSRMEEINEVARVHHQNINFHMFLVKIGVIVLCSSILALLLSPSLGLAMMIVGPVLMLGSMATPASKRWPWTKAVEYPTEPNATPAR